MVAYSKSVTPAPQEIRRRALCPTGKSFDLSVVRQDFLKRCFKVIFVSTRTMKGKYKQTSLLTRKLTKLAPKLIRGLWFLKNIVRKQATCEWLMCLQTAAMTSGAWKPFKGGVAEMWSACFIIFIILFYISTGWFTVSKWRDGDEGRTKATTFRQNAVDSPCAYLRSTLAWWFKSSLSITVFVPAAIKAGRHLALSAISKRGWHLGFQQGAGLPRGCPSVTSTVRLKANPFQEVISSNSNITAGLLVSGKPAIGGRTKGVRV